MRLFTSHFAAVETGAFAMDWLLLTATAIGLTIGGLTMTQRNLANQTATTVVASTESSSFTLP